MILHLAVLVISFLTATGPASTRGQEASRPDLGIRIEAAKTVVSKGEPLSIRVEFTNRTQRDLYVARNLTGVGSNAADITFAVWNSAGQAEPGERAAADCVIKPNPDSLLVAVMKNWVALPPGSSYATSAKLGPSPFLERGGRYKIVASYESRGIGEQFWTDCVRASPSEIAKLPFTAWEGKIESNPIWIKVVDQRTLAKTNRR